ncbi:isoprenylcysteine carboxylmethyltransferase family protein [Nocardiopsis alba]|uniref:Isoprenylcysteine carboxylmethyltransferase family protein n=1 Tax=Nocardiopsis alba TaxID=53437 RepID=A0A7K2IUG0_9ACTN|nr:isoprenylcysteine carboxylmethyltransferase family protein [Nocardiopsis alba]
MIAVPSPEVPALIVRGLGLFLPVAAVAALCLWRAPGRREIASMIVASGWALCTLVPLNLYAVRVGWWSFHVEGASWQGIPVDLLGAWALLWGALPALALRLLPIPLVTVLLVWVDMVLMPLAEPVVVLGAWWVLGEVVGVAVCLIPALTLAFWTRRGLLTGVRGGVQALLFLVLMVVLPVYLLATAPPGIMALLPGPDGLSPPEYPGALSVLVQLLALACLPGVVAAREFAVVGGGTPLPYDPPARLVTSGPYAYVRNPMQLSMALLYLVAGVFLHPVLFVGTAASLVYGAGFASWDEGGRMRERFGSDWEVYRSGVRSWVPRLRPWEGRAEGVLYVAMDCGMCRGVGSMVASRRPTALRLRPAAEHPEVLYRLTYENAAGDRWSGLAALARAMEHLHLGWAMVGWTISLPGVRWTLQLCADAFGAGPRPSRRESPTLAEAEREREDVDT